MPKAIVYDLWGGQQEVDMATTSADGGWKTRQVLYRDASALEDNNLLAGLVWWRFDGFEEKIRKVLAVESPEDREKQFAELMKSMTPVETITRVKRRYHR